MKIKVSKTYNGGIKTVQVSERDAKTAKQIEAVYKDAKDGNAFFQPKK